MDIQKLINPNAIWKKVARKIYLRKARHIYNYPNHLRLKHDIVVNNQNTIYFCRDDIKELVLIISGIDSSLIEKEKYFANTLLNGEFHILSHLYNFDSNGILWRLDPVTETLWSDEFSFDIAFRGASRLSDIKLPWELAKMQYLFILGKAYCYTDDKRYATEIVNQIKSWIDENPPFCGIHWISALEVGARVISFIMSYPFIVDQLNSKFLQLYLNSIYHQTEFVEDNLSYSKNANTHLIGEAFTLVLVGLFLDSPKSDGWYKKGVCILSEELTKQVYSDGIDKEQSLNYQRFFMDYYYMFVVLHKQNSLDYPKVIDEYVEKMTEFLMYSLMPDGSAPIFGDVDDARGIYVKNNCMYDYKSLLALGAILFKRSDFKFVSKNLPEDVLWLLGKDGVDKYRNIKEIQPSKTSMDFDQGGYYIMRNGWGKDENYLIFDCGPLGHGKGGHGHADALSFQLYANGQSVFIDPGTYSYNFDYEWRDYFRSTYAHNTITVDGMNQSEINDRMSWKSFAQSKCNLWLTTDKFDMVDGEHDGYRRLHDPVSHRRIIFSNKNDYYIIFDLLTAKEEHTYDYNLHLHPDCEIEDHKGMVNNKNVKSSRHIEHLRINSNNKKAISFFFNGNDIDQSIKTYTGSENPRAGWYSKNYGSKEKTTSINVSKKASGDTRFLLFINASSNYEYNVEQIVGNKAMAIKVNDPITKEEDIILYSMSTDNHFVHGDICFDGQLFFLKRIQKELKYLYARDVYNLTAKDIVEFNSTKLVDTVCYDKNTLKVFCPEGIISNLKIVKKEDVELFINEKRYNLLNSRPVVIKGKC